MEINTYYYTLSTIAQTLAALLGLATVFVVLRLGDIFKNINDYKGRALEILKILSQRDASYKLSDSEYDLTAKRLIQELQSMLEKYPSDSHPRIAQEVEELSAFLEPRIKLSYEGFVKDTVAKLDAFTERKDKMVQLIRWPAIVTGITITISVLFLGAADLCLPKEVFLFVTIILAVLSLFILMRASWKLLNAFR